MKDRASEPDFYAILQVHRDASADNIRGSYRRLMQRMHPDSGGDTATAALINRAYAVLSEPASRLEYDARLTILERVADGFGTVTGGDGRNRGARDSFDAALACSFCAAAIDSKPGVNADPRCSRCLSPLAAAQRCPLESGDQRGIARIPRELDVTVYTDWRQGKGFPGRTRDVSLGGLRLVTSRELRTGQHLRIVSSLLDAVGEVTHCTTKRRWLRSEFVAGVSFLTLEILRSAGGFVSDHV